VCQSVISAVAAFNWGRELFTAITGRVRPKLALEFENTSREVGTQGSTSSSRSLVLFPVTVNAIPVERSMYNVTVAIVTVKC